MTAPNPLTQRLIDWGATFTPATAAPGQPIWQLINADGPMEMGGNHHLYVDVLDASGQRLVGIPVEFFWSDSKIRSLTEAKPGEMQATNMPLYAGGNAYGVRIADGKPSDELFGVGLGDHVPHHAFKAVFQLAALPEPAPTPSMPRLTHPVQNAAAAVISQTFGATDIDYSGYGLAGHAGLDFAIPVGMPIVATDGGVVQESGMDASGYGEYIKLRHAWGESLYAHLSARVYEAGIAVRRGEVIGRSGNTGNTTGPHLHFAIRINPYTRGAPYDGYSDPLPYLDNAGVPLPPAPPAPTQPTSALEAIQHAREWLDVAEESLLETAAHGLDA